MNRLELEMIEKRFLKISLEKNYVTGEKKLTYCYASKEDYKWHRERLFKTKWEVEQQRATTLNIDGEEIDVFQVKYRKKEKPDWEKKKNKGV